MLNIPMTNAQFAALTARLHEGNLDLMGTAGTITKDGVTANYRHADNTLTVEIVDKPFFMPLSLIEATLQAYFEKLNAETPTTPSS